MKILITEAVDLASKTTADILGNKLYEAQYRSRGAEEGDGGGEECQRHHVGPHIPLAGGGHGEGRAGGKASGKDYCAEYQHVEGNLERGDLAQHGAVGAHDVYGVAQRRCHDQKRAHQTQRVAVAATIEQPYSA